MLSGTVDDDNKSPSMSYSSRNESTTFQSMDVNISSADLEWLQSTLASIRLTFLPIVLSGTITNCLNFVVLSHREMRSISTAVYLLALAVADLGLMYFELFRVWFEWTRIAPHANYFNNLYCGAMNYINGVTRDYSNWLIACVTLERLVLVACPYRARDLCTPVKAKRVVIGLLLVICVPHIHWLFYSRAQYDVWWVCWEDPNSLTAKIIAATVEFCVGYIVVIVVCLLNVILSFFIYTNRMPHGSSSSTPSSATNLTSCARQSHNRRLTRTLLLVAVVFLVCETPRLLMSLIVKFIIKTPVRRIILNASFALSGINHAANFFIYIVSSPRFRQLLVESLRPSVMMLLSCPRRCRSHLSTSKHRAIPVGRVAGGGTDRLSPSMPYADPAASSRSGCCCLQHLSSGNDVRHEVTVQFNLDVFVEHSTVVE